MRKILRVLLIVVAFGWGGLARAQPVKKVARIGVLTGGTALTHKRDLDAFRGGLRQLGYAEGKNFVIEHRYAQGKADLLPGLASELVGLKVDVIFVIGSAAVEAAKSATQTIPIVQQSGDPVEAGLVASLARPGGNVTGLANLTPELAGKRLELLKEVVPRLSRVGVLWTPDIRAAVLRMRETEVAAKTLGVQIHVAELRGPNDLEPAFLSMKKGKVGGLVPLRSLVISTHRKQIIDRAAWSRLPAMYDDREFAEAGGLMSYGAEFADLAHRAATYVDKILKGRVPADLPIEQPMRFELVINLKTANQIGLTIPQWTLMKADKVIK